MFAVDLLIVYFDHFGHYTVDAVAELIVADVFVVKRYDLFELVVQHHY